MKINSMKISKTWMFVLISFGVLILGIVIFGFATKWKFFGKNDNANDSNDRGNIFNQTITMMNDKIKQLENEKQHSGRKSQTLIKALSKTNPKKRVQENQKLQIEIHTKERQINDLKQATGALKEIEKKYYTVKKIIKSGDQDVIQTIQKIKENNRKVEDDLARVTRQINTKNTQLKNKETLLSQTKELLQSAQDAAKDPDALKKLQAKITEINKTHANEIEVKKYEINQLETDLQNKKTELETSKSKINQLKKDLQDKKTELENSKSEIKKLKETPTGIKALKSTQDDVKDTNALSKLQTQINKLNNDLQTKETALTNSKSEITTKEIEINKLKNDLQAKQIELGNSKSEINALKKIHATEIATKETALNNKYTTDIEELKTQILELNNKYTTDIDALKTQILELKNKYTTDIEELKKTHATEITTIKKDLNDTHKTKITTLESNIKGLNDILTTIRDALSVEQNDKIVSKINELNDDVKDWKDKHTAVVAKLATLNKEINDNISKIKNTSFSENSKNKTSEDNLTAQVNSIVAELDREQKLFNSQKQIVNNHVQNIENGKDVLKVFNITDNNLKDGINKLVDRIKSPLCKVPNTYYKNWRHFPIKGREATDTKRLSFYHSNKCAAPGGGNRRWCYTTDPVTRWGYCDDGNVGINDVINDGKTTTVSGNTCQRWDCIP